ncbi:zinc carboxypeptidase-like [Condylostylus longicornis]|uniref:zinc carboxypeptidase-like n=1 Tax=Condylostylus longicornis TaxID=2530218 RepID=UPI00244E5838|nr:zinc carboxypeptidase-like [Condylostylus longicornis]
MYHYKVHHSTLTSKRSNNIIVSPQEEDNFQSLLTKHNITFRLYDENVQETLDQEEKILGRSNSKKQYDWTTYHTLEETYDWMKNLSNTYPEYIELLSAGSTYEGREILGVKISYKSENNKGVLIEGGIHAREWISPATTTYILNELLHSTDSRIRYIAENFNWYIFPHTNPDGYVYTHTKDRLWRKTRSYNGNYRCLGVDPNRNFDYHWNEQGTSSNPCSDAYAGKEPFSEIETRTFSNFISSLRGKINIYISFHSYSQLLLFPYGYTDKRAPNHDDLQKIGDIAASALSKRYGTQYKVGNIYETIYPASGSSIEWAYDIENIKLSYCYELRPKSSSFGWNGFILPPNQIIPTGQEIIDSLIALLDEGKRLNYF